MADLPTPEEVRADLAAVWPLEWSVTVDDIIWRASATTPGVYIVVYGGRGLHTDSVTATASLLLGRVQLSALGETITEAVQEMREYIRMLGREIELLRVSMGGLHDG